VHKEAKRERDVLYRRRGTGSSSPQLPLQERRAKRWGLLEEKGEHAHLPGEVVDTASSFLRGGGGGARGEPPGD